MNKNVNESIIRNWMQIRFQRLQIAHSYCFPSQSCEWCVSVAYGLQQQGPGRCVSAQMAHERADPHAATDRSLRGLFLLWHRMLLHIAQVICLACKRLWEQLCKFFSWGSSSQYNFLHSVKNCCPDWSERLLSLQEMTDNDLTNISSLHIHNQLLMFNITYI